ncbi:DUF2958 domain-containing protein [Limimaricola sp. G21655-S1]|uniref:DUF2958 domain-containing protein n=1 Tax=Limimaricola sp. G21655-S1 TaxID=3014768 RepID=UPI0022AEEA83|nr:DUF2958 domain-containing protein [Limimaricola sp. G21655-S1]MCZ4262308.1 DUF2958 domain-containing protein [Limimaricola sp. G21655-S1]
MKLLTQSIRDQLLRNGRLRFSADEAGEDDPDFLPVVKLFTPDAGCTWLLTELDPEDNDIAFGLCDLGVGFPELGTVRISELEEVKGLLGLPVERDLNFSPKHPISVYSSAAWYAASITERPDDLDAAARKCAE